MTCPRLTLLFAALLLGAAACSESPTALQQAEPVHFETLAASYETLVKGHYGSYDFEERQNIVIRSQKEFEAFWQALYENRSPTPELPEVDFSQNMVVAAMLGVRPTGGYAIEVQEVAAGVTAAAIHVQVRTTAPGDGCGTYQALTSPYHVVKVAATASSLTFADTATTHTCE